MVTVFGNGILQENGEVDHAKLREIVFPDTTKHKQQALSRKGTTYVKMAKSSKDYELAIEAFNKALTEHWNPDTLQKLNAQQSKQKKNLGSRSIMIQQ